MSRTARAEHLRAVAAPAPGALPGFADAAQAALARALARNPVALVVIYEDRNGIRWEAAPHSAGLVRGMVNDLHDGFSGVPE
jgi:hypothetical protein